MQPLHILLVEDDAGDAGLIRYNLKFSGHEHQLAWVESLRALDEHMEHVSQLPDIVLLDLNLPESTGLETVNRCKDLVPDTPIVVLTGHDDLDFSLKTLEAGSQDYLVKNAVDADALIRSVRYAIERHQLERKLYQSEQLMNAAIEGGNLGVWEWNISTNECHKSDSLLASLGLTRNSAELSEAAQPFLERIHCEDIRRFREALNDHLEGKTPRFQCEFRVRHEDGDWPWQFVSGHVVNRNRGQSERIVGIQQDISERKALEAKLTDMAMHDELTRLFNRRSFMEAMNREYGLARRDGDYPVGLLMLDIDHFKRVNDTYGHAAGDEILKAFSKTVSDTLRETDILGRLGGEEFAILLPDTGAKGTRCVAQKVRAAIEAMNVKIEGVGIRVTTSIGMAALLTTDQRPDGALVRADQALYAAKQNGRNCVVSDAEVAGTPANPAIADIQP